MRRVDRKAIACPGSLSSSDSEAARERSEARAHYERTPPPKAAYKFGAYKAEDVRTALTALFHGKCAYCEGFYRGTQQMDVEHYRPKGKLSGAKHRGYWWLALSWENLLPSCTDCNRSRTQRLVSLAEDGSVRYIQNVAGKGSVFPIAGPSRAGSQLDDVDLEEPLLLDPTRDDPEDYFRWVVKHLQFPLVASAQEGTKEARRARVSIDVYGLNRDGLVGSRSMLIQQIALEISNIRALLESALELPEEKRARILGLANEQISQLKRHEHAKSVYSTLAASFIQQEMRKLRGEFSRVLDAIFQGNAQASEEA
ncbi:hypothetical protein [Variovorax sp. YR216]|uniref:hypothetical protein n=1 Tax=Variovorax sp. YR216 TaxID=1882828 RepID=UPI00089AE03F|nr:hypothetical protein [Variovorax sp. YR216]SEA67643.1 TIGR02646 family protein [Variovorax sp. YR216]